MATPQKINISRKVKTIEDINMVTEIIANGFAEYMSEVAKEFMQDYINQKVYLEGSLGGPSDYYERTYDLKNAVVARIDSNGQWYIRIDGRKLHVRQQPDGMWGQHIGVDGQPVAGTMQYFLEEGNNSPLYSYDGIEYIEATEKYLNEVYLDEWRRFRSANNL